MIDEPSKALILGGLLWRLGGSVDFIVSGKDKVVRLVLVERKSRLCDYSEAPDRKIATVNAVLKLTFSVASTNSSHGHHGRQ